ncbi:hypothetical protein B0H34DRAFT_485265 [Crassisporium funariophilum]|nr:hypothetical protein B0H34DRAFT_485265 [Crassisporium funariophilum]
MTTLTQTQPPPPTPTQPPTQPPPPTQPQTAPAPPSSDDTISIISFDDDLLDEADYYALPDSDRRDRRIHTWLAQQCRFAPTFTARTDAKRDVVEYALNANGDGETRLDDIHQHQSGMELGSTLGAAGLALLKHKNSTRTMTTTTMTLGSSESSEAEAAIRADSPLLGFGFPAPGEEGEAGAEGRTLLDPLRFPSATYVRDLPGVGVAGGSGGNVRDKVCLFFCLLCGEDGLMRGIAVTDSTEPDALAHLIERRASASRKPFPGVFILIQHLLLAALPRPVPVPFPLPLTNANPHSTGGKPHTHPLLPIHLLIYPAPPPLATTPPHPPPHLPPPQSAAPALPAFIRRDGRAGPQ